MKIIFASSSTWHDKFLLPISQELDKLDYTTEQVRVHNWKIDNPDDYVFLSYHEDISKVKKAKAIFIIEHAISVVKSFVIHKQCANVDYALVQGEVFSQWWTFCHPNVKQIKCGWHRIEKLYSMDNTRDDIIARHNLNPNLPIILYCPTWGHPSHCNSLNGTLHIAYPILKKMNIPNLLIIPHPSCVYGNACRGETNVIHDVDIYDYLSACDLLIGDNSSILIEFTLKNKPIIQLNKSNNLDAFRTFYAEDFNIDDKKNLFGFMQLGQIIPISKNSITNAIDIAFKYPYLFKANRDYWKSITMYNLGTSLKITIDSIVEIIKKDKVCV